ncbi:MAG: DUF362 domain-containing protein [Elusimicrobiota bacterium]|jgi:uncharacterized protein (DUF362 family)/Pyruvate/2-oxoacid:ferredoxin oxidoreductase delta subunit|nr:DUF362 domain-containing protein [Elusimicrobiota bacterium]
MDKKISLIKCADYKDAEESVNKAIDLIGDISSFVKPNEKILIKPNLLAPKEPQKAITTHPEIVRAAIRLVKKAGAFPIVGDSPGGAVRDIENLWEITQMRQVCKEENAELVQFEAVGAQSFDIGDKNIKQVTFSKAAIDCDGIINLPKLKTHSLMSFTCGIKNFYGCVPGLLKVEYHKYASKNKDFASLLTNIYLFLKNKIRFTLVDGVWGMEGNGPSAGEPRQMNIIAASKDTPFLDAYLMAALGYDISKNYILKNLGITKNSLADIEMLGNDIKDFDLANLKFPKSRILDSIPPIIVKTLGKLLWIRPSINKQICVKCFLCANSCPAKAISASIDKFPQVDDKKCISCFCCHEMCPYKAIDFKKSFLAGLFVQDDTNKK